MTPNEKTEYDRQVGNLRAGMDENAFAAAWAEGHAMSMEQAIAFALESGPR